jgi:hypothetical protein
MALCQGPLPLLPWRIACLLGTFIASRFRIRLRTVSTAKRSMDLLVTLPNHSQVSILRAVALAQLPSARACSLEGVIWYTDLLEIPISHRGLVQSGRHPDNSMPMPGVAKMHPSCRLVFFDFRDLPDGCSVTVDVRHARNPQEWILKDRDYRCERACWEWSFYRR